MKARLSRLLASRRIVVVAAALAVVLLLPTLTVGFMMDDFGQLMWLKARALPANSPLGIWDLFRFQDADPVRLKTKIDLGYWPWWTNPELRIAFFRPVTSLTHALDHALFPNSPALMRLESLLMYGGLAAVVGLLYRRISGATVAAGLAIVMYALDDAHGTAAAWISNRNAILAGLFGFLSLYLHDRGLRDGDRRARVAAPFVFALAMLSGEAAAGTLGYVVAHAMWMEKEPWKQRILRALPFGGVAALWTVVYKLGGYGAWGGEFYIDPGKEPVRFATALVQRMPVLFNAQLGFLPSDVWTLIPSEKRWAAWGAVMALVILGAVLLTLGVRRTRENAFYATGAVLSLVHVCAGWPGDRMLIFAGFGAFGLCADLFTAPREGFGRMRLLAVRVATVFLVTMHLIVGPLFLVGRSYQLAHMLHDPIERGDRSLPPPAALAGKTLVIVNGPDQLIPLYSALSRMRRGEEMPDRIRQLTIATQGKVMLARTGERTVQITQTRGFFHDVFSLVFRMEDEPIALGQQFRVAGMTVTAKAFTSDRRRIGTMEFELDAPLEDPGYVWVIWRGAKFEAFTLPAVGEEVEIPAVDYTTALSGT
ncbi:MAG: hypothetical protein U0441_34020 [Polyangiaceae bacterium]